MRSVTGFPFVHRLGSLFTNIVINWLCFVVTHENNRLKMTKRCQNCDCTRTIVFSVQGMYTVPITVQCVHSVQRRVHSREKGYGEGGFGGLGRPPSWSAHRIFGGEGGFGYIQGEETQPPSLLSPPVLVVLKNKKKFNFLKSRLKSRLNKQWAQVWTQ